MNNSLVTQDSVTVETATDPVLIRHNALVQALQQQRNDALDASLALSSDMAILRVALSTAIKENDDLKASIVGMLNQNSQYRDQIGMMQQTILSLQNEIDKLKGES